MMNHQECLSWWSSNGKAAKSAILRHADLGKGKDGKLRFKSIEAYLPEGTRRFLVIAPYPKKGFVRYLLLPQGWERMKVRDLNKLLVPAKFKSFPLT